MIRVQRSSLPIVFVLTIFVASVSTSQAQLLRDAAKKLADSNKAAAPVIPTVNLGSNSQTAAPNARRITVSDAVSIFLQRNFQLIAARYDIDTAEAEKLTARLRPNPEVSVGFSGLPVNLSGNLLSEQQYSYAISQTFEMGGKRSKRIDFADRKSVV